MSSHETTSKRLSAPASFHLSLDLVSTDNSPVLSSAQHDAPIQVVNLLCKIHPEKKIQHAATAVDLSLNTHRYSAKFQPESFSKRLKTREEKVFSWLKDKEYTSLSIQFKEAKGYLANEILSLSSPLLMEQIFLLEKIVTHKNSKITSKQAQDTLNYALSIAKSLTDLTDPNLNDLITSPVEEAITQIGQLIFLCEQNPLLFLENFNSLNEIELKKHIQTYFNQQIDAIHKNMQQLKAHHEITALQDGVLATTVALPLALTKLLLTHSGEINTGLIPLIIENFVPRASKARNHEINLHYGLNLFLHSPNCRHLFSHLKPPTPHNTSSQWMIRIMLSMAHDAPVEKIDAQRAAMSAMLSHLRQTPAGTCFAESLAIELLSSQLEQCLMDFIELIQDGKLTRKIRDKAIGFPFLLSAEKHKELILVNSKCEILSGHLWDSPGIIAVCKVLNLNPQTAIKNCIKRHFTSKTSTKLNANQLLRYLVLEKVSKDSHLFPHYYDLATFTYESQQSNPLLKVWRNAIAGMAEAHEGSMIKSSIIAAIKHALDVEFKGLDIKLIAWINKYYDEVNEDLINQIQLEYDPNISRTDTSTPNQSLAGAFVLYDKNRSSEFNDWLRVDTPLKFQEFIIRVLKKAKNDFIAANPELKKMKNETDVTRPLFEYILSDAFIIRLLKSYHESNKAALAAQKKYKELRYTPWITKSGNDTSEVLQVYLEKNKEIDQQSIKPTSAKALLQHVISLGRSLTKKEIKAHRENPHKLIPAKMKDMHAFSLMLGHTSLFEVLDNQLDMAHWIATLVENPGKNISKAIILPETAEKMVEFCKKTMVKDHLQIPFAQRILTLNKVISHHEFRNALLNILQEIDPVKSSIERERAYLFDTELCKQLPACLHKILRKSAVHFADTNWCEGVHDLHFCFIINPGSGEMELFEVYDNGSRFIALDQKYWLTDRDWQFCTPLAILPGNEGLHI